MRDVVSEGEIARVFKPENVTRYEMVSENKNQAPREETMAMSARLAIARSGIMQGRVFTTKLSERLERWRASTLKAQFSASIDHLWTAFFLASADLF
jgi:hypothetical protein